MPSAVLDRTSTNVIPAKAGIQRHNDLQLVQKWIPAFAQYCPEYLGRTGEGRYPPGWRTSVFSCANAKKRRWFPAFAGKTILLVDQPGRSMVTVANSSLVNMVLHRHSASVAFKAPYRILSRTVLGLRRDDETLYSTSAFGRNPPVSFDLI